MIQGTAVLRGMPNRSREAVRTSVSGICVADESQRKTIPAARHRLATVLRSETVVNCPSKRPKPSVASATMRVAPICGACQANSSESFESPHKDPYAR